MCRFVCYLLLFGVLEEPIEAADTTASNQRSCGGDLLPYSADNNTWVCDGSTLVNGSSLELVAGSISVSESDLTAATDGVLLCIGPQLSRA